MARRNRTGPSTGQALKTQLHNWLSEFVPGMQAQQIPGREEDPSSPYYPQINPAHNIGVPPSASRGIPASMLNRVLNEFISKVRMGYEMTPEASEALRNISPRQTEKLVKILEDPIIGGSQGQDVARRLRAGLEK